MIRSPFTHIPSFTQFFEDKPNIDNIVNDICFKQYDNLKYAKIMNWKQPSFTLIRTDDLWDMINTLNNMKTAAEIHSKWLFPEDFNTVYKPRFDRMVQWPFDVSSAKHIVDCPFDNLSWKEMYNIIADKCYWFMALANFSTNTTYYLEKKRREISSM